MDNTLKDDIVNGTTKSAFVAIYMHVGFNLLDSILMAVGKFLMAANSVQLYLFIISLSSIYTVSLRTTMEMDNTFP